MESVYEKFNTILGDENIVNIILKNVCNTSRTRSLLYNLRKFPHLKENLLNGTISPYYFAKDMTCEEMLPQDTKNIKQSTHLEDTRDGIMKCDTCDSMKTEYSEIHTLEYTIFLVYCKNCGHTSKI